MASGTQNLTTYLAKGLEKILTTNAANTNNLLYINTTDTNITADMLGDTTSIAFTRMSTTGAYTTGHIVWLNAANIGTPFQLVVHDSSDLYLYKRWKSSGTWSEWTKMSAGHADDAVRITGNLAAATSDVSRNIWVSSTASADGIPNYISGFNMNPSTKVFTIPAGTRISPNAGALYLGNSGNQSWVYIQDMCSQDGQKWKIHQNGNAEFSGTFYSPDTRGGNLRLISDWLGFYASANVGGNRYGYIECNANRMYFRKENSSSQNEYFDFGSRIYTPSISCGYTNTSYTMSTSSFICQSWIRTTGSTGWYNESYGGGWYMTDAKWVRSYGSKPVYTDIASNNAYGICGHRLALGLYGQGHVSLMMRGGDVMYGFGVNNNGNWYFGRRTSKSFESTSGDAYCYYGSNTFISPISDNAVSLGGSSNRWSAVYGVKVYNAVWNDYAECRHSSELEPGRCVTETSSINGMIRTTERLLPGCKLVSDTYGTLMGETDKARTPIAVSGRVLAYPYRDKKEYSLGAAVCSAPNGTVDIMTREEIMKYPERIVGTVSEIPTYEIWSGGAQNGKDDIQVNGRIWIYVR